MKRASKKKPATKAYKTLRVKPEPEAAPAVSRAKHLHNVLLFVAEAHGETFDVTALEDGLLDILSCIDSHAMPVKALVEIVSKIAEHVSADELRDMSAQASHHRDWMRRTIEDCRRDEAGIPATPDGLVPAAVAA